MAAVNLSTGDQRIGRTLSVNRSIDSLVADDSLTRQQKIQTLMRWQHEARLSEIRGRGSRRSHLTCILRALHALEANEFV